MAWENYYGLFQAYTARPSEIYYTYPFLKLAANFWQGRDFKIFLSTDQNKEYTYINFPKDKHRMSTASLFIALAWAYLKHV